MCHLSLLNPATELQAQFRLLQETPRPFWPYGPMARLYWPYGPEGLGRIGPRGPGIIIVLALGARSHPSSGWEPRAARGAYEVESTINSLREIFRNGYRESASDDIL